MKFTAAGMQCLGIAIAATFGSFLSTVSFATTISFSGGNTPETVPWVDFGFRPLGSGKPVVVGTFASSFDPLIDLGRHRLDDANNFAPTYYFSMVAGGDFRPFGQTLTTGLGQFSGTATVPGIAGERIWLVLWDAPNQLGANSVLVTSFTHDNWIAATDGALNQIDIAEADRVIFGDINNGRVVFWVLPIPEPSPIALAVTGVGLMLAASLFRRRIRS